MRKTFRVTASGKVEVPGLLILALTALLAVLIVASVLVLR